MKYFSSNLISDSLSSILETIRQEPVIIAREQEEIAVILSIEDYKKLLGSKVEEFQLVCDRVAEKAQKKGLTAEKLLEILQDE